MIGKKSGSYSIRCWHEHDTLSVWKPDTHGYFRIRWEYEFVSTSIMTCARLIWHSVITVHRVCSHGCRELIRQNKCDVHSPFSKWHLLTYVSGSNFNDLHSLFLFMSCFQASFPYPRENLRWRTTSKIIPGFTTLLRWILQWFYRMDATTWTSVVYSCNSLQIQSK